MSPSTVDVELPGGDANPLSSSCEGRRRHGDVRLVDPDAGVLGREPDREALGAPVGRDGVGLEQPARRAALGARAQARRHDARIGRRPLGGDLEVEVALAQEIGHEPRHAADPHPCREGRRAARRASPSPSRRSGPSRRARCGRLTRAFAPARSTMSRASTASAGPSELIRAEMRPTPARPPWRTPRASRIEAEIEVAGLLEELPDCGNRSRSSPCTATWASSLPRAAPPAAVKRALPVTARLAELHAQVAEGRRPAARSVDIGGGLERLALDRIRERQPRFEPAEIAQEAGRWRRVASVTRPLPPPSVVSPSSPWP